MNASVTSAIDSGTLETVEPDEIVKSNEIVRQASDTHTIQAHLLSIFDNVATVTFHEQVSPTNQVSMRERFPINVMFELGNVVAPEGI